MYVHEIMNEWIGHILYTFEELKVWCVQRMMKGITLLQSKLQLMVPYVLGLLDFHHQGRSKGCHHNGFTARLPVGPDATCNAPSARPAPQG